LAAPLNVHILQTLEQEPKTLLDLRQAVGSPPQSTMRLYSRTLSEQGIIDRNRTSGFPGSVQYELTQAGRDLIAVARVLEAWLATAPAGPISIGTTASKSATKALVEGWSTNIVRAIAARPLSLTELNTVIPRVSYPSLERRLGSMRLAGLLEPLPSERRGTPYGATDWLRQATVPVAAAAAWERRHRSLNAQPIGRLAVEAAFLLAMPLLEMPTELAGRCRLAVEVQGGSSPIFAGVLVSIEAGRMILCTSRLDGSIDGWVSGSPDAWLRRMGGVSQNGLELGGDVALPELLLRGLEGLATLAPPLSPDLV